MDPLEQQIKASSLVRQLRKKGREVKPGGELSSLYQFLLIDYGLFAEVSHTHSDRTFHKAVCHVVTQMVDGPKFIGLGFGAAYYARDPEIAEFLGGPVRKAKIREIGDSYYEEQRGLVGFDEKWRRFSQIKIMNRIVAGTWTLWNWYPLASCIYYGFDRFMKPIRWISDVAPDAMAKLDPLSIPRHIINAQWVFAYFDDIKNLIGQKFVEDLKRASTHEIYSAVFNTTFKAMNVLNFGAPVEKANRILIVPFHMANGVINQNFNIFVFISNLTTSGTWVESATPIIGPKDLPIDKLVESALISSDAITVVPSSWYKCIPDIFYKATNASEYTLDTMAAAMPLAVEELQKLAPSLPENITSAAQSPVSSPWNPVIVKSKDAIKSFKIALSEFYRQQIAKKAITQTSDEIVGACKEFLLSANSEGVFSIAADMRTELTALCENMKLFDGMDMRMSHSEKMRLFDNLSGAYTTIMDKAMEDPNNWNNRSDITQGINFEALNVFLRQQSSNHWVKLHANTEAYINQLFLHSEQIKTIIRIAKIDNWYKQRQEYLRFCGAVTSAQTILTFYAIFTVYQKFFTDKKKREIQEKMAEKIQNSSKTQRRIMAIGDITLKRAGGVVTGIAAAGQIWNLMKDYLPDNIVVPASVMAATQWFCTSIVDFSLDSNEIQYYDYFFAAVVKVTPWPLNITDWELLKFMKYNPNSVANKAYSESFEIANIVFQNHIMATFWDPMIHATGFTQDYLNIYGWIPDSLKRGDIVKTLLCVATTYYAFENCIEYYNGEEWSTGVCYVLSCIGWLNMKFFVSRFFRFFSGGKYTGIFGATGWMVLRKILPIEPSYSIPAKTDGKGNVSIPSGTVARVIEWITKIIKGEWFGQWADEFIEKHGDKLEPKSGGADEVAPKREKKVAASVHRPGDIFSDDEIDIEDPDSTGARALATCGPARRKTPSLIL